MSDIVRSALASEPLELSRKQVTQYMRGLDAEESSIHHSHLGPADAEEEFRALNTYFFGPTGYSVVLDMSAPENISVAATLAARRGTCLGLAIVYLNLAQRLGLDAHAVATPDHLFVRLRQNGKGYNVELLEQGRLLDDDIYRRRYKIDDASIAAGIFMADLTNSEVIAHLLSNQAIALSRQGKLDDALVRYDKALRLHPHLVAAWYNRGTDLLGAGRLQEALDNFNHAIELYASDAEAHNNRGLTKLKMGDLTGARADFTRALELQPDLAEADTNLRRLDALTGKHP